MLQWWLQWWMQWWLHVLSCTKREPALFHHDKRNPFESAVVDQFLVQSSSWVVLDAH
jgi:hypothetical protein